MKSIAHAASFAPEPGGSAVDLVIGKNRTIPLQAQRFTAECAETRGVAELPHASHAVTVSEPGAVTDLMVRAAR